ncbi:RICIN domain-containing protein [Streptomyces sp. DSM 41972]|uniref:RICIN domain-containing protein n=1 Tax=Streptomyces althioticus subsp. attaecolombicae TaxID=3075534 RepID=A0ABU3HYQ4_9ACTN|nr:RICIN domain-containing protein [Streptomyces sp. DSM 41972]
MARSVRGGAVAAFLTALLVVLTSGTATAADPPVRYTPWITDAAIYEMRASYSRQCMDVRGGSQSPGAIVQRFDCKGKLHQRFYFTSLGNGQFVIGVDGRYCVGAQNGVPGDGAPMVIGHCQGPGQIFRWTDRGNGHYEIVDAASGLCLRDNGRREPIRLGACGQISEPSPSLWTPLYHRQYDYTSLNG